MICEPFQHPCQKDRCLIPRLSRVGFFSFNTRSILFLKFCAFIALLLYSSFSLEHSALFEPLERISVLALEVLGDFVVPNLLGDSILDSSLEKSIVDSGQRADVLMEDSVVSIELESGDQ